MTLAPDSYTVRELLVPVFVDGTCVYQSPSVMEIRDYCQKEQNSLWDEYRRLRYPHTLPVDLSQKLYDLKMGLIKKMRGES